jgi:hypothetical protein
MCLHGEMVKQERSAPARVCSACQSSGPLPSNADSYGSQQHYVTLANSGHRRLGMGRSRAMGRSRLAGCDSLSSAPSRERSRSTMFPAVSVAL